MNRLLYLSRRHSPRTLNLYSNRLCFPVTRLFHVSNVIRENLNQSAQSDLNEQVDHQTSDTTTESTDESSLPWYLREQPTYEVPEEERSPVPEIPEGAPRSLEEFLNLMSIEYGLDSIEVFDLKTLDSNHPNSIENQPFEYVIIATGKSERHIYKAGQELKHYIKHNYSIAANINGLVSNAPNPIARRRMMKRANKAPLATDNDYGRSANSWIMCETGIDSTCIHILTKERRDDLNLESLWKEQLESEHEHSNESSESSQSSESSESSQSSHVPYFFQARRNYHTISKRSYSQSTSSSLFDIYNKLATETSSTIDNKLLANYIEEFNTSFQNPTIEDYNLKTKFYTLIHIFYPQMVSFEDLNDILISKYSDLSIVMNKSIDLTQEKQSDIVKYVKLLMDSPELKNRYESKSLSDYYYHSLSQFFKEIYRFSDDDIINLEASPELIPMIWKLAFTANNSDNQLELSSLTIDEVLYNNNEQVFLESYNTWIQAKNRTRDINDILEVYLTNKATPSCLSRSVKEFQLICLGNASNWHDFWNHWEISMNLLDENNDFQKWMRLIIYLALRNNVDANKTFIQQYWKNLAKVSSSFLQEYTAYTQKDNLTLTETNLLKLSLTKIVNSLSDELSSSNINELRNFIDSL